MSAADLVAQLAEAGTPPALLAAVAQRLFTAEVEIAKLETRRSNERERKARSRDVTGQDVTGRDFTSAPSPLPPPLKSPPDPQKITPPISPQPPSKPRADKYHRLPEEWRPRALPPNYAAKVDQWPPGSKGEALARFKNWAANAENKPGKGRKLDWDRAWWNWIDGEHDKIMRGQRNGYRNDTRDPTTVALELLAAKDRDRENAQASGANFDVGGSTGGMDHGGH